MERESLTQSSASLAVICRETPGALLNADCDALVAWLGPKIPLYPHKERPVLLVHRPHFGVFKEGLSSQALELSASTTTSVLITPSHVHTHGHIHV